MALPVLETPKYKMTIPTTKQEVEFRPFLVKEEKLLLLAQESNDIVEITNVMIELVNACTFEKIDIAKLTTVDLEYAFLQLRAKSVGEVIKTQIKCEECGEFNEVEFDVRDIKIIYPEPVDNKVEIQDGVGLILKPFTVQDSKKIKDDNIVDNITTFLISAIETVWTNDELIEFKQCSPEEQNIFIVLMDLFVEKYRPKYLDDFVGDNTVRTKIQEYLDSQPRMSHTIKFKCVHCGHENEVEVSGLAGFFG